MEMLNKSEHLKYQFQELNNLRIVKIKQQQNDDIQQNSAKLMQQPQEKYIQEKQQIQDDTDSLQSSLSTSMRSKLSFDSALLLHQSTPNSSKSIHSTYTQSKSNFIRSKNLTLNFSEDKRARISKIFKSCKISNSHHNAEQQEDEEIKQFENLKQNHEEDAQQVQQENSSRNSEHDEDEDNFQNIIIEKKKGLYESKYTELEELGTGRQATVKKVEEIETGKIFAAKIFIHMNDEEIKSIIKNEFETLQQIDHPNILKVFELIEQEHQTIMIMEYVQGDNLEVIKYQNLSIEQIVFIIKELIKIIEFIHHKNIIHRDLQNKNVLFDKSTNQLKLIDFGIAKTTIQKEVNFTPCGDQFYMAPEMIQGLGYNEKVDIYQIGCLLYELIEQIPQIKSMHLIKKIKHHNLIFKKTPEQLQNIILEMLTIDQKQRISGEECLEKLENFLQIDNNTNQ